MSSRESVTSRWRVVHTPRKLSGYSRTLLDCLGSKNLRRCAPIVYISWSRNPRGGVGSLRDRPFAGRVVIQVF